MASKELLDDCLERPRPQVHGQRRRAIAAESFSPNLEGDQEEIVKHPKSSEQLNCLQEAASNIVFFKNCDSEQMDIIFQAMFRRQVAAGEKIIRQGDDGDNFYVIQSGQYKVSINSEKTENIVATLKPGAYFGELALLYNCPRNATVTACSDGVLWGLDRKTFRNIVVTAVAVKRQKYEELLDSVGMFKHLDPYERMNLTDALHTVAFGDGERIISEGDSADDMFFIMEGCARVSVRKSDSGEQETVNKVYKGQYFGELGLMMRAPRIASVYAEGRCTCAVLSVSAFERLLGPCVEIMQRNLQFYESERERLGLQSIQEGISKLGMRP